VTEWDFLELQAFALVDLGIPHQTFRSMTPAQYFAAVKRGNERQKAEDYRVGLITCVMRKLMGDKKAEPFDFFPGHKTKSKKSAAQRRREFEQQLLAAANAAKRG
jgi:hypothetical protein